MLGSPRVTGGPSGGPAGSDGPGAGRRGRLGRERAARVGIMGVSLTLQGAGVRITGRRAALGASLWPQRSSPRLGPDAVGPEV